MLEDFFPLILRLECFDAVIVHILLIYIAEDRSVILHLVMPLLWEIWRRNSGLQWKLQRRYKLLRFNRICLRVIFNWLHPTLNNGSTRGKI